MTSIEAVTISQLRGRISALEAECSALNKCLCDQKQIIARLESYEMAAANWEPDLDRARKNIAQLEAELASIRLNNPKVA